MGVIERDQDWVEDELDGEDSDRDEREKDQSGSGISKIARGDVWAGREHNEGMMSSGSVDRRHVLFHEEQTRTA